MATVAELIKNETHPEGLRELALFINEQAEILAKEVETLKAQRIKEEAQRQEWLNSAIRAQLNKLRSRFFGHGRETLNTRDRRTNDDQLLLHAKSLAGEPMRKETAALPQEEQSHVFVETSDVVAKAKEKDPGLNEESASVEEMTGLFETSTEITITERTYKKVVHKRQKYKVTNKTTGKETIVTAPGPLKLMPGCRYSLDFALQVVAAKFMNHMPYERVRRDMKRQGLKVPVMTMYRLSEFVAHST